MEKDIPLYEYCTSCGKTIEKEELICSHCNAKSYYSKQKNKKNKFIAGLLAIFLGAYGIHKFYLRKYLEAILYILWILAFGALHIWVTIFYKDFDPASSIWYFLPHVQESTALFIILLMSCLTALIAFIEGIILLSMSDDTFNEKYNSEE